MPTGPPPIKLGDHDKSPCNNKSPHGIENEKKNKHKKLPACATYFLSDSSSYQYNFVHLPVNMIDLATQLYSQ